MKKLIILFLMCIILSGCSLIPKVNFNTPTTVPQATEQNKSKFKCSGKIEYYEDGSIKSCSKGFYAYEQNYQKLERKMTIVERIKSFINNLAGWSFWIFIALIIFVPGLLGSVIGRIIEGTVGLTGKSLRATAKAIQKVRKHGKDLDTELAIEQDEDVKKYIKKMKEKEGLK